MIRLGIALVLGAFVAGCGNSPDKVCEKLGALQEKATPGSREPHADCVKKVGEIKEKDAAKFECLAKCADESDMEKAKACITTCAAVEPSGKPEK